MKKQTGAPDSSPSGPVEPVEAGEPSEKRSNGAKQIPQKGEKGYSLYLLKRCFSYFAIYKINIFIAMVAMAFAAAAEGATAYLAKPALDDIFIGNNKEALIYIPVALLVVTGVKVFGRITQNYMMNVCALRVLEKLRSELYFKIIKLPISFYETTQIGMLMSRIMNDVGTIQSSLPAIVQVVRQILTMGGLLFVVFYMDYQLAILSILVLPAAFFPFIYYGRKLRKLGRKGQSIWAEISSTLQEILSGIRVVKAFSTEAPEGQRFNDVNRKVRKVALRKSLANESSSAIMEMVGMLGASAIIFIGGNKVINGQMTTGEFFAFVAALFMLYDPVKKLSAANNNIQEALAGAERVFEVIDSQDVVEESSGEIEMSASFSRVEFDNVNFHYASAETNALSNLDLTIRRGERLALVGPSGAGKTTFVHLLPRFYDPTSGLIRIDGTDLREFSLPSLRSRISIVSQDNFLFNTSIRENIAYGQAGFSDEKVFAAAEAAYAHSFIMDLPEGYDTVIGERGVKLSGGQKQRLTIARALAKDAPLLILDEATSALDSESEKIVQKALENLMKGRTSIVIAHRLSTVLGSDRILVMNEGRVEAQGTHKELLARSPLYAKLYEIQFGEGGAQ